MKASSTPLIVLLAAIAASTTRTGGAISHKPTFATNHPSKNVDVTFGLKVDRDGNLYFESSSRATSVRSAPSSKTKHLWKYTLRGGSSVGDSSSPGSLQVDAEGNFFFASSAARNALTKLRGGKLSVDPEGNLYTPRDPLAKPASAPPAKATAAATAASPEALRGGSGASPHRLGGLCVDGEGNLYAAPTDASLVRGALGVRGGALCVDNEGNFYTPRAETPKPLASNRRGLADSDPVLLVQRDRKVRPRKAKAKKSGHYKKEDNENPNAFIGFNNALMET